MKTMAKIAAAAIIGSFATEVVAEEWNVSVWGKRRAFTE
ncbi:MAG: C4-dicarboxylate ABC transporter substrate-binding protein, partial [Paracoccaceae bacterium]